MYKNASGLRKISDEWEPDEEFQYAAAGIKPRASQFFLLGTKFAILMRGVRRDNFAELAYRLNRGGKLNAKGQPWTHFSVRVFVKAFLPQLN